MISTTKPDNRKQNFIWRKKCVYWRIKPNVRLFKMWLLLLQQKGFLLSGFRPRAPQKVKKSNYSIYYYKVIKVINYLVITTKTSIVRFLSGWILTLQKIFSLHVFKHKKIVFWCLFLFILTLQHYDVRFQSEIYMTSKNSDVRFFSLCSLTTRGF